MSSSHPIGLLTCDDCWSRTDVLLPLDNVHSLCVPCWLLRHVIAAVRRPRELGFTNRLSRALGGVLEVLLSDETDDSPQPASAARQAQAAASSPAAVEPDVAEDVLLNDKALKRWGKKVIDFGKEHKGLTFEQCRTTQPSHAIWVMQNVKSRKTFTDNFKDYAKYLFAHQKWEKALVGDDSDSDEEEEDGH